MPREIFPGDNAPPMPKKRMYPENRESDAAALVIAQTAIAALDIPALEQAAYERGRESAFLDWLSESEVD